MKNKYLLFGIFIGALIVDIYYFSTPNKRVANIGERESELTAVIYKTPICSCCENYISYLKSNGFFSWLQ
jgi:hypothetical protein